jgi:hypothetical protein
MASGVGTREVPLHPDLPANGWSRPRLTLLADPVPRAARTAALIRTVLVLALVTIQSVVVWNTFLATTSGIVAGSFCLGLGTAVMVRAVAGRRAAAAPVGQVEAVPA